MMKNFFNLWLTPRNPAANAALMVYRFEFLVKARSPLRLAHLAHLARLARWMRPEQRIRGASNGSSPGSRA